MDDKVKTWVDGKLIDLTEEKRAELAQYEMPRTQPPLVKGRPPLGWKRRILTLLLGAEHPLYNSAEALLSWGWLPFALLIGLGVWLHFKP